MIQDTRLPHPPLSVQEECRRLRGPHEIALDLEDDVPAPGKEIGIERLHGVTEDKRVFDLALRLGTGTHLVARGDKEKGPRGDYVRDGLGHRSGPMPDLALESGECAERGLDRLDLPSRVLELADLERFARHVLEALGQIRDH